MACEEHNSENDHDEGVYIDEGSLVFLQKFQRVKEKVDEKTEDQERYGQTQRIHGSSLTPYPAEPGNE